MKIGEVSVVPVSGFKTLGEVAMLNGDIVVTAKEGMLRVEGNGPVINVARGKTITVRPEANNPQGGASPGAGRCCGGSNVWGIAATAAGGVAAILAGVALSRAGTASTNASEATSAAEAAAAAAAAAASAASAALSAEILATEELGCALNVLANEQGLPSVYTPPSGVTCASLGY
jgi:hypothetical protein